MTPTSGLGNPLDVSVIREGDGHVVHLRGAASLDDAETLRDRLDQLIGPSAQNLIVDMTELSFITSLGIGALVTAHGKAKSLNGNLVLVNPSPAVARLLKLTRLDQLLATLPSLDDARKALGGGT